ncbi:MAG: hypothetical protein HQL78_14000 [Magnetococcales bacterium]|nr:hypothetical protein [Magnetococcales bacterium]
MNKVAYYGVVKFGETGLEAAVLDDGRRGFVRTQLAATIGLSEKSGKDGRFRRFLKEISPDALELYENKAVQVVIPNGQEVMWVDCSILLEIVNGVINAALKGTLHPRMRHAIEPCRIIQSEMVRAAFKMGVANRLGSSPPSPY